MILNKSNLNQVRYKLWNQVYNLVYVQVCDQARYKVYNQVYDLVYNQLYDQYDQVYDQVRK